MSGVARALAWIPCRARRFCGGVSGLLSWVLSYPFALFWLQELIPEDRNLLVLFVGVPVVS